MLTQTKVRNEGNTLCMAEKLNPKGTFAIIVVFSANFYNTNGNKYNDLREKNQVETKTGLSKCLRGLPKPKQKSLVQRDDKFC